LGSISALLHLPLDVFVNLSCKSLVYHTVQYKSLRQVLNLVITMFLSFLKTFLSGCLTLNAVDIKYHIYKVV